MSLQVAIPDDFIGVNDDQKVRAAIASTEPIIAFNARMHQLYDPTPIPVRTMTLSGPGKHTNRGIQINTGGCANLFAGNLGGGTGSEIVSFRIKDMDIYGANDVAHPNDGMFNGFNAKHCQLLNCVVWGFTGTTWNIDGPDSLKNLTRDCRINGGTNASSGACAIALYAGNTMETHNDYISGYQTLLRSRVSGLDVFGITMERAVNGGDAAYLEGGSAAFFGGWVDPSTCGRTIVQTSVGSGSAAYIRGSWTRGVYPGNVHITDTSKFIWTYNLS